MLDTLGKYQLRRELGKGAMGIVYEGFDPFIQRTVAIKTIQTSLIPHDCLQETLGRFRREAQAAGRLTHPNIIAIYEYGEDEGMAFIAMELVSGHELLERNIPASAGQIGDSLHVMQQLLDALDYSHQRGVIHRDIKPANIMVTREGQIKIADFGIAKIDTSGSDLTQLGTIVGTPIYMSPEQMEGQSVDARSDLYSAGVLLYQLLTGTRPFGGGSMTEIMNKVLHHVPPAPSSINHHVPPTLDRIVMQAIDKNPTRRFSSAAGFSQALKTVTVSATADAGQDKTQKLDKAELTTQKKLVIEFDLSAASAGIEQFLAEQRKSETKVPEPAPASAHITLNLPEESTSFKQASPAAAPPAAPPASQPGTQPNEDVGSQSSLLQALAQEAASTRNEQKTTNQLDQMKSQPIHDALSRLHAYLKNFSGHVDAMHPLIPRQYSLDARTQFNNLKWQASQSSSRQENLKESTRLTTVNFSITLSNSTEVKLARPWSQLEALQRELQMLKLRVLNDNDLNFRLAKHESIQATLYPSLTILLDFSGNYETGTIELRSLNLGQFGSERFQLSPEAITPAMLDELGLFLLGRSNKLPAALKRI